MSLTNKPLDPPKTPGHHRLRPFSFSSLWGSRTRPLPNTRAVTSTRRWNLRHPVARTWSCSSVGIRHLLRAGGALYAAVAENVITPRPVLVPVLPDKIAGVTGRVHRLAWDSCGFAAGHDHRFRAL
jgi:hypothetical protein